MGFLESFLERVAIFQKKYALPILLIVLLITFFLGLGISKIRMESDINKEMPQDLPIFKLNDKISDSFGGQDTTLLLFMLDNSIDFKKAPKDIRNPKIISYLEELQSELEKESLIDSVGSVATYTSNLSFKDINEIKDFLESVPQTQMFFSKDYRITLMYVVADVGSSDEKVKALSNLIDNKIKGLSLPSGVKVLQTGPTQLRITIFELLGKDAAYTLSLAALIILLLLFITERSITKGLLVFLPLTISLLWTMGTMGWLEIKLSVATVGLGSMILGLGVEYGVFMLTRYKEERNKNKNQLDSLKVAVPGVGSGIMGSGTTTIVGFLALTLSIMPMMQHLGVSLALGIFYSLFAAVFVLPCIIILEEQFEHKYIHHNHKKYSLKKEKYNEDKL